MRSLTLPSMGPTSGAEKFCSSARKDFFDSIDPNRNCRLKFYVDTAAPPQDEDRIAQDR